MTTVDAAALRVMAEALCRELHITRWVGRDAFLTACGRCNRIAGEQAKALASADV